MIVDRPTAPLFLDAGCADRLRSAISGDPFAASVANAVLDEARMISRSSLLSLRNEPGRGVTLPTARDLFHRVTHLGVAAILTGNNGFRRRGVLEIVNASSFDDWNPSHFLDTAEMATAVAIGLDWFSSAMSGHERKLVTEALATKALAPAVNSFAANAFWVTATTNWNVVCCGGAIVAAAVMKPFRPDLADEVLSKAVPAIASGLSAFDDEGGYPEGHGYWEYATKYAALALAALDHAGMAAPSASGLDRTWRYGRATTAPSGDCFNFGDTLLRPDRSPVLGWLALRSGEAGAKTWQRTAPGRRHALDLIWLADDPGNTVDQIESCTAFNHAGIAVLRDLENGRYIGLKGGRNDVNHAHLDLGSFILEWDGLRFVSELGRDDYALPGYFDSATRFGYFRLGTSGHGTLNAAGQNQSLAAHAEIKGIVDQPGFTAAALKIHDPANDFNWQRGVAMAGDAIWIVDEVVAGPSQDSATWQAFARASVSAKGAKATLSLDGQSIVAEIIAPEGAIWHVARATSPAGEASNEGMTTLSFLLPLQNGPGRCAVAFSKSSQSSNRDKLPPIAAWGLRPPHRAHTLERPT
jgi:hypothetical protein